MTPQRIAVLAGLIGAALVVASVALISLPAAGILGGLFLISFAGVVLRGART